jgi:hypothetical protein
LCERELKPRPARTGALSGARAACKANSRRLHHIEEGPPCAALRHSGLPPFNQQQFDTAQRRTPGRNQN